MKKRVVIIGGGPAGLFAAISAAGTGADVTLLEKLPQPGRKLLATGGGKCNIGNTLDMEELAASFGRQGRFMLPALERFYGKTMRDWFRAHGVLIELDDDFHYYPASRRAGDVLAALLAEAQRLGVQIKTGTAAAHWKIAGERLSGVETADGAVIPADAAILATGGRGYTALGGGTSGYHLAEEAGHTLADPVPGLVGLRTVETWPGSCAGLSLPDVRLKIALPRESRTGSGELLFTRQGISAYAVLDISGRIAELLQKMPTVPVTLNLFPGRDREMWKNFFADARQRHGSQRLSVLLGGCLPRRLAMILAGEDDAPLARLRGDALTRIIRDLTELPLHICGTEGWERAMVTHGGVKLKEVAPGTLASRILPGLFFAGEVLDLDGPCGGYNLSWAMASGMFAGQSATAASSIRQTGPRGS